MRRSAQRAAAVQSSELEAQSSRDVPRRLIVRLKEVSGDTAPSTLRPQFILNGPVPFF